MNIHNLNFLKFSVLIFGMLLVSCKQEKPLNTVKEVVAENSIEQPKKKISEQYSPDKIQNAEKEAKAVLTTLSNTTATKSSEVAQKPKAVKKVERVEVAKKKVVEPVVQPKPKKVVKARAPEIEFEELLFDFGEIMQGDKIDHKFKFTNTGNAPLSVNKADATCGCATPSIPFMDIMPGEQGFIGVSYNSVGKEGEEVPQVTIFTNAKTNPNQTLKLKGFVKVPEKDSTKTDTLKKNPFGPR